MKPQQIFKLVLSLLFIVFFQYISYGQKYKDMMNDNTINFYDVLDEADLYFKTIDKNAKKSGFKQFMRWVVSNEYKYYPSGNRLLVNPEFSLEAYQKNIPNKSTRSSKSNINGGWREIGPISIENISGHWAVGMGRIDDFSVDPDNNQNIYISSRSGGLWKTLDEGTTWTSTGTENLPASGVNSIAVNPTDFNHVYVTLQNANNRYSFGIYESLDGGASFNETGFNPTNLGLGGLGSNFRVYTIAHHPTIANLLLVGTSNGLYKTTDNFTTWTQVITSGDIEQVKFHPTNSNIIYVYDVEEDFFNTTTVIERDLVHISNDTGNTFSTTNISANNANKARLAVTESAPDELYFASKAGVFKSTDNGQTFTFISDASSGFGADVFSVNSTDNQNMLIGALDGANSTDGGITFTQRTYWHLGIDIHGTGSFQERYLNSTAYVHADLRNAKSLNGVFYIVTDGCIAKSTDGGITWQNLMQINTPGIRENYKLGISQSDNSVAICGAQDAGTSVKNPDGWVEIFGGDGMEGVILPLNPEYMIGSYQFGGRIRTLNAGLTFADIESNGVDGWWQTPIIYDPNDQFKIYDFKNGVYISTDFGLNYTYVGTPSFLRDNPDNYWWQIRNAEIAQNNSDIMIVSRSSEIEKSIDGGVTFSDIKNNLPDLSIQDIAFNPNDDDDIIVVNASYQDNDQKVFRSTNGGASWSNITFNIGDIPVHSVVIDHTDNPYIYIGTEIGVYYKSLNTDTWVLYNDDLPNVAIEELEINYGANTIKAATWGRGLWEYDLVGRNTYPSIENTSITVPPTLLTPAEGNDQFVTSIINYSGSLTKVEVKYSVNNQLFDNTISMTNTSGNTWVSDEPLANTAIMEDKVFFKVVATGSNADTSSTYKFMYEVREFEYCEAAGSTGTGSDYIEEVTISGVVNSSGKNQYTLYDSLAPIELNKNETYSISVDLLAAFSLDKASAWIDYDKNAVFDDSELINMSPYISTVSTGSLQIPNDAVLGNTIMRVRNTFGNSISSCGTSPGEVEDYLVTIVEPITLSTDEFDYINTKVSIYPNPSDGDVNIKFDKNILKIKLFDLKGSLIIQQNNLNKLNTQFNIEHLKVGTYMLNIYTKDEIITKKIIKTI